MGVLCKLKGTSSQLKLEILRGRDKIYVNIF